MFVNLSRILKDAKQGKYAVGAFNVYNYETIKGVVESARELNTPVIVAFGERYMENMELSEAALLVRAMAEKSDVPIALHLDHCKSSDTILKAIDSGFTSVMFDGSDLKFEDNIKQTGKIVKIAHAAGITVEAELGALSLGAFSNEEGNREIYTNPLEAKRFAEETGIDALAVSIGTVHGMYKGEPKINIDILKEISGQVDIPLVLHGGSGTPETTIKECIKNGICKINVNTEISMYTVERLKELLSEKEYHLSKVSISEEVKQNSGRKKPSGGLSIFVILLPIILILFGTVMGVLLKKGSTGALIFSFLGDKNIAMLIGVFVAMLTMRKYIEKPMNDVIMNAAESSGLILLITGAGGSLGNVINGSGIGQYLVDTLSGWHISVLVLAFILSQILRAAQGSTTVALVTTSSILGPVVASMGASPVLVALAICAGGIGCSLPNDSGFWVVQRFSGLSVTETVKSWTLGGTIAGVTAFIMVLILNLMKGFLPGLM